MSLQVVLFEPLIPQNTGSIARLTAATAAPLHLIEPLGFELSDRYLKRAGLDYWPEVKLQVHASWEDFLASTGAKDSQLWFFSKRAKTTYYDIRFENDSILVFGNEERGLSPELHERYAERLLRIPIDNEKVRSINLSCATAVGLYEARRQLAMR